MKASNISELFGTLIEAVGAGWRKHLKTDKYSKHMALDEFYKEMPEKVDALVEAYQGVIGKVDDYVNILDSKEMGTIEFLEELRGICKSGYDLLDEDELKSAMDNVVEQIDSTLYKIRELKESLSDYLKRCL